MMRSVKISVECVGSEPTTLDHNAHQCKLSGVDTFMIYEIRVDQLHEWIPRWREGSEDHRRRRNGTKTLAREIMGFKKLCF